MTFFTFIQPLWAYFRAPHVRYEFDFVPKARLCEKIGKNAVRFAVSLILLGLTGVMAMLLMIAERNDLFRRTRGV